LERYFYIIAFGSYQLTQVNGGAYINFSSWMHHHADLFRLLDDLGGATYEFNKVMKNSVLKFDHFPGILRLAPSLGPNVLNFRRVDSSPIFGTGQVI